MGFALSLYGLIVAALTMAEWRDDGRAQAFLKPLCALGFILLAVMCGALDSAYGLIILTAFTLCAVGDVALLARDKPKLFLLGMAAFGLGHLAFAAAFFGPYMGTAAILSGLNIVILLGIMFKIFIWKEVPKDMRAAVATYVVIIAVMVMAAVDTAFAREIYGIWFAALMFAASDFFVARDRFVAKASWHPFIITPLYFGAQALFALSILQF